MADRQRVTGSSPHSSTTRRTLVSSLGSIRDRLQARLYLGVPWGTLLLCALLLVVYAGVQRGADTWSQPLVVPFTAWSYHYPLGVLLGPVSHQGPSHLLENLVGVLVFGSAAEFLIGHYPTREGERGFLGVSPLARAFVIFPTGAVLGGVVTSAFSWGPTLGFSNVVFLFAGVVLVRYPLGTVVALAALEALVVVGRALTHPLLVAGRSPPAEPWFVDTAVQSHTFGLLCGAAVGTYLLLRGDIDPPSTLRLWTGTFLFGLGQSLWVVWWPRGPFYVLARRPGVVLVAGLATVVTAGTVLATRGFPALDEGRGRQLGFAVLVLPLAVMAGIAVPLNATATADVPQGAQTVDVNGFRVTYAEDVPNQRLAPFGSLTGDRPTTSGVLVVHPENGIWTRVVPATDLDRHGTQAVRLGGPGWERRVFAVRRAWRTTGGDVVEGVWLNPMHGGFHRVYASPPARSGAILEGYAVTVVPADVGFRVRVSRDNRTVGTVPMPNLESNVTVDHLELRRARDSLVAVVNRTRVPVASRD